MDPDSKVREVFALACDLEKEARQETLDKYCANDATLREEVDALLEAYDRSDMLLEPLEDPYAAARQALEGRTVSHYKVGRRLGAGGMGVVYEATDERLRRRVALKFLPPGFGRESEARKRFETEAQTAAAADHPNVCTVYEIGETNTGRLFIAMALCEGATVKDLLKTGPLSAPDSLDIGIQIAEALARVHEKEIFHRDIKPSNIIVQEDGLVKIVDFGIAKLRGGDLTGTTDTLGTVGYMAPEQITGRGADHLSDIWSVGVVLYEMLSGLRPFEALYAQAVTYRVLNEEPESLVVLNPAIPLRVAQVVERCLQKEPEARFETANDLLIALHRLARKSAPSRREFCQIVDGSEQAGESKVSIGQRQSKKVFLCYKHGVDSRRTALPANYDELSATHMSCAVITRPASGVDGFNDWKTSWHRVTSSLHSFRESQPGVNWSSGRSSWLVDCLMSVGIRTCYLCG